MVSKRNIKGLVLEYLEYIQTRNYSDRTYSNYRYQLQFFTNFLKGKQIVKINQVDKKMITKYQQYVYYYKTKHNRIEATNLTTQAQISRLSAVKSFFNYLEKQEIIVKNSTRFMDMPKLEKRIPRDILNPEEVNNVLQMPDTKTLLGYRDRAIIEIIYSTGARRSEIRNLEIYDINFTESVLMIRHGKGAKDRMIPVGKTALEFVKKYINYIRPKLAKYNEMNNALFLSKRGKQISLNELNHLVKKYREQAGIKNKKVNCHGLRSSMATSMLKNGADLIYIQKILGHSRPESTQIYTQVDITDLKKVHKNTHPRQ